MVSLDTKWLKLKGELSEVLNENILKYWIDNAVDKDNGGFIGHINSDNTKVPHAGKGIILNARILWTFAIAYRQCRENIYMEMADRSYHYIRKNFRDLTNGGVFWEIDFQGKPVNKRKQVYAQAFTIYALSEYYKINKNEEALKWAIELFELIEKHSRDKRTGGYIEAFAKDWSTMDDVRLSEKDANEKKTMNTHLHVLEAYTNLIMVWSNKKLISTQKELIRLFLERFINEDGHLNLFFTEYWELKSHTISFGHDIEASWLLVEAAEVVGDKNLISASEHTAVNIADVLIKEGMDNDGSIFNEKERKTGHFDTDKHWWQQAEGMVGFMNAFQISRDKKYIDPIFDLWKFINDKLIDHKQGEWYWRVDKAGKTNPEDEKIGFWKCPYHNTRACIEMINRIDSLML